jgi:riboflavin synthase
VFTGIVEDIGKVTALKNRAKETVFTFEVGKIDMSEVGLGDSIAVNGTCLTVTSLGKNTFTVDASHETMARTNLGQIKTGGRVNLERALKVGDKLGGHIVNGHVDGVGKVKSTKKQGGSVEFRFAVPDELSRYIVEKGSVAVDGVSLTVNAVEGSEFAVNIIPYTLEETTFGGLKTGSPVNIECDIVGKYVEKFVTGGREKDTVYQFLNES